jgi:1,5-anhydro-D-fructose reductase (1,5-anhydro-D-mannitol-forming)
MTRVRWGLVGASTMAHEFVGPAIARRGHAVAAVCSRSRERGAEVAGAFGGPPAFTSIEAMLDAVALDAVYVSSTNDLHAPQTIAAAAAGVHVLCEKPLALDLASALAMERACREAGVVLATNHHLRASPAHRRARALVAAGEIGTPLAARVQHASLLDARWRGWRLDDAAAGAGAVLDLAVHDVDLLRFVLGREVEAVAALTAAQGMASAAGVEDAAMALLRFEGDVLASCHVAFTVPNAPQCLEVFGSAGSLTVGEAMATDGTATLTLRRGGRDVPVALDPPVDAYEYVVDRFVEAIHGRGAPAASGRDGVRSLAAALAIGTSATTGRTVAPESAP